MIQSLVCYCPECAKAGEPKFGSMFVVYGSHTKQFHIYEVEYRGVGGYVPHLVQLKKVIGENVIYEKACGICGVTIYKNENGLAFYIKNWQREITTIQNWNSWLLYKTDKDYWL